MARRPRIEVAGKIYDVYNRVASGESIFSDADEATISRDRSRDKETRWLDSLCLVPPVHPFSPRHEDGNGPSDDESHGAVSTDDKSTVVSSLNFYIVKFRSSSLNPTSTIHPSSSLMALSEPP